MLRRSSGSPERSVPEAVRHTLARAVFFSCPHHAVASQVASLLLPLPHVALVHHDGQNSPVKTCVTTPPSCRPPDAVR